jgi:HAD superfamily hydrolase (TIGR01450 family)
VPEVTGPDRPEPDHAADRARLVDRYDLVILDLDGVVYLQEEPVPGAVAAVERLRREGPPVVYVTNNASRSREQIAGLLARLGVDASAEQVLTSGTAAGETLARELPAGSPVLVVGAEALAEELRRVGLSPVSRADQRPVAVLQGYGPQVGWAELAEAGVAIRSGARWVVTNTDATMPSPRGPLPGNGALVAALRTAVGRDPDLVVGKPQPTLFATAARRAGAGSPLVVGDRLDTDIDGARRAGMDSLLVLTGVDDLDRVRAAADGYRPTYVGADLTALFAPPSASAP